MLRRLQQRAKFFGDYFARLTIHWIITAVLLPCIFPCALFSGAKMLTGGELDVFVPSLLVTTIIITTILFIALRAFNAAVHPSKVKPRGHDVADKVRDGLVAGINKGGRHE